MITKIIVLFVLSIGSREAYKIRALSKSGAFASFFVGASIYIGFEIKGLILLGIFFGTSSFWSVFKGQQKKVIEEKMEKGSQRDWVQVLANGGVAALASLLFYFTNQTIWLLAFITSIASATGDTWSSEIGPLSRRLPVSIRNFKVVSKGTSGAISLLGTVAALLGIGLIILSGYIFFSISLNILWIILAFAIVGNGMDTFLGAYFQRIYRCEICFMEIERPNHCGEKAKIIRGLHYLNNDGVNFLSSFLAPSLAILTYLFIAL
ncbi:DUF92 domain-containing protein [Bacillus sp. CGMCC 1.16607]|uniref:DUF92 domain-containing protein n=1 Tax=Bacillus sp. CGMCC 1.16607 TaxID=3351842 RepID=UPI003644DCC0